MPYQFLEDMATADIAFEATGKSLEELFVSAAEATTNVMIRDLQQISKCIKKEIRVEAEELDFLLFDFLQEIIYYKDAELLLFGEYSVKIGRENDRFLLNADAIGEELDGQRHELVVDVKAVTMHQFEVKKTEDGWMARVVLDI